MAKKERAGLAVVRQPFLVFFRNARAINRSSFQAILAVALAASVLFLPAMESSAAKGEGRFFILLGKAFAETMLGLHGK